MGAKKQPTEKDIQEIKQWMPQVGVMKTSQLMGVSYEVVRRWCDERNIKVWGRGRPQARHKEEMVREWYKGKSFDEVARHFNVSSRTVRRAVYASWPEYIKHFCMEGLEGEEE